MAFTKLLTDAVLFSPAADKWALTKGIVNGNGGLTVLQSANNLSDIANVSIARENLGLRIGTDVQAYSSVLSVYAAGDVPSQFSLSLLSLQDVESWRDNIGAGTVKSVTVSGGSTGLVFTGGTITDTGTLTLEGTLLPENGGTGTNSLASLKVNLNLDQVDNTSDIEKPLSTAAALAIDDLNQTVTVTINEINQIISILDIRPFSESIGIGVTGSITTLLSPFYGTTTWSKSSGDAAIDISSTGGVSLNIESVASQTYTAIATATCGTASINQNIILSTLYKIVDITTSVSSSAVSGDTISDITGVPPGSTPIWNGDARIAIGGNESTGWKLIVGVGTLTIGDVISGTIAAEGAIDGSVTLSVIVAETYWEITPASITNSEGNSGTTLYRYTVTRSGNVSGSDTIDYAVTGSGSNPADANDFGGTLSSGSLLFAVDDTTKTIDILVTGDTTVENDEEFTVTLSNASRGTITTASAIGIITNDDVVVPPSDILLQTATWGLDSADTFSTTGWVDETFNFDVGVTVTISGDTLTETGVPE